MKTIAKFSIQSIVITGVIMITLLYNNTSIYAYAPIEHNWKKSKSEKITKQVDKIKDYLELLKNVDEKKAEAIQFRIDMSQKKIHDLMDESESEMNVNEYHAISLPFHVYKFDAAENSLILDDFNANRSGSLNSFHLNFVTTVSTGAKVDIVSPGGELLQSISKPDFRGSFDEEISLNSEKGKIYFVHIDVNGKSTTKKLIFR